jgi:hypothetical protein
MSTWASIANSRPYHQPRQHVLRVKALNGALREGQGFADGRARHVRALRR